MIDAAIPTGAAPTSGSAAEVGRSDRQLRAIGYVRVAAESSRNSRTSLDRQTESVRTRAHAEGLELVEIIADSGASAHNLSRRGLQRLVAAVEAGAVGAVIVPICIAWLAASVILAIFSAYSAGQEWC